ncbi:MAG TPA: hypothetical protein VH186_37290 [Chloroflexia bacterium]|nr:hypothetical protein [Chloroflexia bacterium]
MKCVSCQSDIPAESRFCNKCGASQPASNLPQNFVGAADGGSNQARPENGWKDSRAEFSKLERQDNLDPTYDYESSRRYGDVTGKAVGCVAYFIFAFFGILSLVVVVPFLAIAGLPLAILAGILTYFDLARFRNKVRSWRFLQRLPGFNTTSTLQLTFSVSGYLAIASIVSLLLMIVTTRH